MAVYVFKTVFEEFDDVMRVIHVKGSQTFEDLHNAIQDSIGFDKSQLASFYLSDDTWKKGEEITLMDMSTEEDAEETQSDSGKMIMSKTKIGSVINDPHQKFVYIFDFMEMWTFHIELIAIQNDDPKLSYPACVRSVGKAPRQYENLNRFKSADDTEFDEIARSLMGDKYDVENDSMDGETSEEEGDGEENGLDDLGGQQESDDHY